MSSDSDSDSEISNELSDAICKMNQAEKNYLGMRQSYQDDPDMTEEIRDEKREWYEWKKKVEKLQEGKNPEETTLANEIIKGKCSLLKPRTREQIKIDELVKMAENVLDKIIEHLEKYPRCSRFTIEVDFDHSYKNKAVEKCFEGTRYSVEYRKNSFEVMVNRDNV